MSAVENRLLELGLELPPVSTPVANYVPAVLTNNLLFVAGLGPVEPHADGSGMTDAAEFADAGAAAIRHAAQHRLVAERILPDVILPRE